MDVEGLRGGIRRMVGGVLRGGPMPAWLKGFVLAMATLVVNAIGLGLTLNLGACEGREDRPDIGLMVMTCVFGFIPCALAGVALGSIAGRSARDGRWSRWLVLAVPSMLTVVALAGVMGLLDFALVSAIPTLAAVSILERWTRAPRELPVAPAEIVSGRRTRGWRSPSRSRR